MTIRGVSVDEALQLARETKHLEFKASGSIKDNGLKVKVIRAMLAMANNQDGGTIIIGIKNDGQPCACKKEHASTWTYDALSEQVAKHADPYVNFEIETIVIDEKHYVRVYVSEFDQLPVVCKKDAGVQENGKNRLILTAGMMYVRPRQKPASVPVPSQTEMREVLDLAIEKGLRRAYRLIEVSGTKQNEAAKRQTSEDQYQQQVVLL